MFLPSGKSIPKLRLKTGDAGWCFPRFSWTLPVAVGQLSAQQLAVGSSCGPAAHSLQASWDPAKPLLLDSPLLQTAGRRQATRAKSFLLITDCQLILPQKLSSTFLNSWTAFTCIVPSKPPKVQLFTNNIWTSVCATNMFIFFTHFIQQTACGHALTFTKRVWIFFSKFLLNLKFCNHLLGSVTFAFYCFHIALKLILALEDCRRKRKTVAPVRLVNFLLWLSHCAATTLCSKARGRLCCKQIYWQSSLITGKNATLTKSM